MKVKNVLWAVGMLLLISCGTTKYTGKPTNKQVAKTFLLMVAGGVVLVVYLVPEQKY